MKNGGWVPISKALSAFFPKGKNRPYSEIEAAFCLQLDYDSENEITVSGYAEQWGWSRRRVRNFLSEMGIIVEHEIDLKKNRNQRGHITIQEADKKRTRSGQINLINNKELPQEADKKRTRSGQEADKKRSTTIDTKITNTETDKKPMADFPDPPPKPLTTQPEPEVAIPPWLPKETWDEFILHRKQIKSPMTPLAMKKIIAKLGEFRAEGHAPEIILNESIANGWKGIFQPKNNKPKKGTVMPNGMSADAYETYLSGLQLKEKLFGGQNGTK